MAPAVAAPIADNSSTRLEELRDLAEHLDGVIAELDTSRCDSNAALGLLGVFSHIRKTAAAGEALVAARVDECSAHESAGFRSAAHLVADRGGTTVGKAKEAIDTAKRLRECPATEAALRTGSVSVEQAAAVATAVAVDPSAEHDLLRLAGEESLSTLQHRAREIKLAAENDRLGVYRRQHAARSLKHGITDDGMVWGRFQLPPDTGAAVVNTLEREAERIFRTKRSAGEHEAHDRHVADALVTTVTGETGGGESPQASPRPAEVVVHISHDALVRGTVENGETCMIQGVGPIPVELARDIAADAFLTGVLVDGTDVMKIKRFGRRRSVELRTALEVREVRRNGDVRCDSGGCDATLGLEWDHIQPVARDGPTSYENLRPLCRPHHRAKTRRDGRAAP